MWSLGGSALRRTFLGKAEPWLIGLHPILFRREANCPLRTKEYNSALMVSVGREQGPTGSKMESEMYGVGGYGLEYLVGIPQGQDGCSILWFVCQD